MRTLLSLVGYQVSDLDNVRPVTLYWNPSCVHMTRVRVRMYLIDKIHLELRMNIVGFYVRLSTSHIFHRVDDTIKANSK